MRKYDEVQALLKELRECSSDEAYLSRQAADEITRLADETERLRAALARIENEGDGAHAVDLARAALKVNKDAIIIPPEALEAALAPLTYPDGARPDRIMEMRLVAMLKAWPGMEIEMFVEEDYLYLPLPKENTND